MTNRPPWGDWNVMGAVRALRRERARRRWEHPSVDQMVIFIRRQRLARLRSCLGTILAAARLRDFANRWIETKRGAQ